MDLSVFSSTARKKWNGRRGGQWWSRRQGRKNCNFQGNTLILVAISNVGSNVEHNRESSEPPVFNGAKNKLGFANEEDNYWAAAVRGAGGVGWAPGEQPCPSHGPSFPCSLQTPEQGHTRWEGPRASCVASGLGGLGMVEKKWKMPAGLERKLIILPQTCFCTPGLK